MLSFGQFFSDDDFVSEVFVTPTKRNIKQNTMVVSLPLARRCVICAPGNNLRTIFSSASVTKSIPTPAKAANDIQHPDAYDKTPEELRRMARSGEESIVRT